MHCQVVCSCAPIGSTNAGPAKLRLRSRQRSPAVKLTPKWSYGESSRPAPTAAKKQRVAKVPQESSQPSGKELPRKFIRKFGEDISDVAVLTVRNGTVWHIKLWKADGAIWFQNGLQEFLEYHSICAGHFLVFRYDGKSQFYVLIFDMTGSEIDHCPIYDDCEEPQHVGACLESKREVVEGDSAEIRNVSSGCLVPFTSKEKVVAIGKASSFKSKNPFFTAVMRPAYLGHGFMHIPYDFSKKYLSDGLCCIQLQDSDGRSWSTGCRFSGHHIRISKGWSAFMSGNNLQLGDVCVFELINLEAPVLKVHIFPAE